MTALDPATVVPTAVYALSTFVLDVDDPELNWTWDVLRETLEAVARASVDDDNDDPAAYPAALADAWRDFFTACQGGAASHVVYGLANQWDAACPAERRAEQQSVTRRAYVAGWGRAADAPAPRETAPTRRAVKRPTLTLLEGGVR